MVALSVIDIVLLIAGLAFYLFIVGTQLTRIATNLEECFDIAGEIVGNAQPIIPGVERAISRTSSGAVRYRSRCRSEICGPLRPI